MLARIGGASVLFLGLIVWGSPGAAQEEKGKSGSIIGELKARKDTADGKNTVIEVLAPGEEKARKYHVLYDPKIKGPIESVLAAVRAAKIGDRVEFDWVGTGHGPAIKAFRVLKKGAATPIKEPAP
ncbi:MAG: hypothetical protein U0793_27035 [Gemmataceae bacterium]|mgnify:CR=1 FL=1